MKELEVAIDKSKCKQCGLCVKACVLGILEEDESGNVKIVEERAKYCLKCQHCLAACPFGAFSIFGKESENSIISRTFVNPDEMLGLIKTRRSCRHYKQESVPSETIERLKSMLAWAPTGCNNHGLHFSIVEDITVMQELSTTVNNKLRMLLKNFPVGGVLKMMKPHILSGEDVIFQGAPHLIAVSVPKNAPCKLQDPIIALSYFELYAQTLGLGTLWCGLADVCIRIFPSIKKKMEIPKTHKLAYVMLFGIPDMNLARGTQPEPYSFSVVKKSD